MNIFCGKKFCGSKVNHIFSMMKIPGKRPRIKATGILMNILRNKLLRLLISQHFVGINFCGMSQNRKNDTTFFISYYKICHNQRRKNSIWWRWFVTAALYTPFSNGEKNCHHNSLCHYAHTTVVNRYISCTKKIMFIKITHIYD